MNHEFGKRINPIAGRVTVSGIDWASPNGDCTQETVVIIDELHEYCDEEKLKAYLNATTVRTNG